MLFAVNSKHSATPSERLLSVSREEIVLLSRPKAGRGISYRPRGEAQNFQNAPVFPDCDAKNDKYMESSGSTKAEGAQKQLGRDKLGMFFSGPNPKSRGQSLSLLHPTWNVGSVPNKSISARSAVTYRKSSFV